MCESIIGERNKKNLIKPNSEIEQKKTYEEPTEEKKSNDTMDYIRIPTNQSFTSEMLKKKKDDNSFKEKSTNYTNNLQQEKIKLKNYDPLKDLKLSDINLYNSNASSSIQEELNPKMNPLLNSDIINVDYQNKVENNKPTNNGNSFIQKTNINNNNINNNNFNINGFYGFNNQNYALRNNNLKNISISDSQATQSSMINIPKRDQAPLSLSISIINFNNFSSDESRVIAP